MSLPNSRRTGFHTTKGWIYALTIALSVNCASASDAPVTLEAYYSSHAPEIIRQLRGAGHQYVGVLKFTVNSPGLPHDQAGEINRRAAEELMIALILNMPEDETQACHLLLNANQVATQIEGGSYRTPEGRQSLFGNAAKYRTIVGGETVTPDAFVTGEITPDKAGNTFHLRLWAFDRDNPAVEQNLGQATVRMTLARAHQLGESSTQRGSIQVRHIANKPKITTPAPDTSSKSNAPSNSDSTELADDAGTPTDTEPVRIVPDANVRAEEELPSVPPVPNRREEPFFLRPNPDVNVEVIYNEQTQSIHLDALGRAYVREPNVADKVTIRLKLRDGYHGPRLGVVVKVNGRNTLYSDRENPYEYVPDHRCRKWILDPDGTRQIEILGYQIDRTKRSDFQIVAEDQVDILTLRYNSDTGNISILVYEEAAFEQARAAESDSADAFPQVVAFSALPTQEVKSWRRLKAFVLQLAQRDSQRGVAVAGPERDHKVTEVAFHCDDDPIMVGVIRYWQNQNPYISE